MADIRSSAPGDARELGLPRLAEVEQRPPQMGWATTARTVLSCKGFQMLSVTSLLGSWPAAQLSGIGAARRPVRLPASAPALCRFDVPVLALQAYGAR